VLLLATSLIFLFLFLKEEKQDIESNVEVFILNGEGSYWNVKNYKVIKTKNSIWRGSASLNYLGDKNEIIDSNYFSYEFVEVNESFEPVTVLVEANSATNGEISILGNIEKLGSISGPLSPREKELKKDELEMTYLNVIWTDSKGIEKSERIELDITDHIVLN